MNWITSFNWVDLIYLLLTLPGVLYAAWNKYTSNKKLSLLEIERTRVQSDYETKINNMQSVLEDSRRTFLKENGEAQRRLKDVYISTITALTERAAQSEQRCTSSYEEINKLTLDNKNLRQAYEKKAAEMLMKTSML